MVGLAKIRAKDTDNGPATSIPANKTGSANKTGLAIRRPKSVAVEAGQRDGKIFSSGVACGSLRPIGTGGSAGAFGAARISGLPDTFQLRSAELERSEPRTQDGLFARSIHRRS